MNGDSRRSDLRSDMRSDDAPRGDGQESDGQEGHRQTRGPKTWLAIGVGSLIGLAAVVLGVGSALPVEHVATVSRELPASQAHVWAVITDVDAMADWRGDVERVERLPDRGGLPVWREVGPGGVLTFETDMLAPPTRMVTRIADEGLPFGGTWTYDLSAEGSMTRLTLTEAGEVYSPLFRFVSRFLIGHDATMIRYLDALERYLAGGSGAATPEPAP